METPAGPPAELNAMLLVTQKALRPIRHQAMFLIDTAGGIRSWNEGVGLILGWPEDEWLKQTLDATFVPEDAEAGVPKNETQRAAQAGHAHATRWVRRHDGTRFVASSALTRIVDDEGRVAAFLQTLTDLTPIRQAQHDLRQQGQDLSQLRTALQERSMELRAVVDGVCDYAIYTLDRDGLVSSWHQGATLMKGYTAEEAIGLPFAALFTHSDRAKGVPGQELEIAVREGEYQGEGQRMRKDGSLFDAAVVLTALMSDNGELLGYLKLTQDITRRRRMEREREALLRDAQAARLQAELANHSKEEFLATISHELRTPLAAILGWATVLARGDCDAETVRHGVAAISRNARVQAQLIDDLLDMNRIEAGQLRLERERLELGGVVASAFDSALPTAIAKGVGLRSVFSPRSDVVEGDAARLLQVVGNLLSNAIKFTPAGGEINVTLGHENNQVRLDVADNGQGVEPGFLPHIFDRFQQQDASPTRRHGGLGIGLAVVRQLVQLHGGSVQAHSAGPGQGATFTVLLPAADAIDSRPGELPTPTLCLDGVRVLLVDDEPDVRSGTARLLQQAGAQVLSAASAEEALELMQRELPQVLLSDIGMPGVDGYELLRRVRALPQEAGGTIPAAAFTAYSRPEDRARSRAAGYQLHLDKPVSPAELVRSVSQLAKLRA